MHEFEFLKACVTSGFFYLVNHAMDPQLLEEVFAQSKKFFALPLEEKMKVIHDKNHRGYTPFEEEVLDPDIQSKGEVGVAPTTTDHVLH